MREWPWQNPREFLRYGYNVLWHAFSNLAARWVLSSKEKPRFFARSRLRFSSGTVSTEAKELHRQLWTAVARGERRELRALCADLFYVNLVQDHVEHRMIGEVWKWNVHRYHRRPRVLINKAMKQGNVYAQLCVVAFDTTQNLRVWTPSDGNEDKKLERRVENLMIIRTFDPVSLAPNKWLIWGPVPGMTLKDQEEDKSLQYRIGSMYL